jgi:hypothetical protein
MHTKLKTAVELGFAVSQIKYPNPCSQLAVLSGMRYFCRKKKIPSKAKI